MKQPHPHRIALTITFFSAFLAGVFVGNFLNLGLVVPLQLAGLGLVLAFFGRHRFVLLALGLIILGTGLGFARFDLDRHMTTPATLDYYNDSEGKLTMIGMVSEDPDRRADHTKLTIAVNTLQLGEAEQEVAGNILVKIARFPEYAYGDTMQLTGKLKTPFETEEFSYRDYLARHDIYSVMYYPYVEKLGTDQGNLFWAALYDIRRGFEDKLNQVFPEPQASFEAGLLIGSRRSIPDNILEDFQTTGLTHIIAISGYNIALVIAFVTGLLGAAVPRRWQLPIVASFIIIFTLIVGAGAPVVRAAIMGLIAFMALTSGRQHHIGIALAFTAVVMALLNPQILTEISFQLSFAAVLGILYVGPVFERYLRHVPKKFAMRDSLTLTLAAQVTAVPLIVLYFNQFSIVAPLANILVAPAIPLAMLTGFAAVLVGFIYLPAGILLGLAAHGLLSYILEVAEQLAKVPLASMDITWFGFTLAAAYYLALIYGLWRWHTTRHPVRAKTKPPA